MKNIDNFNDFLNEEEVNEGVKPKAHLVDILNMINGGWSPEEVANILLNCTKGKLNTDLYTGFNGEELSKETKYTK